MDDEDLAHLAFLSVVLPALDEAEGIAEALDEAERTLSELASRGAIRGFELLVVDDGSTDQTSAIVHASTSAHVRLLAHAVNRGVGAGLRTALESAAGDVVVYTDADMPVHLDAVEHALALLEDPGVGMVAGYRREYREGGFRTFASKGYDRMARHLLGLRERDVNFPFKVLRSATARLLELRSEGALVDVELLARVHQLGLEVVQVELEYRARRYGSSKTMSLRLLRRLAAELARSARTLRRRPGRP